MYFSKYTVKGTEDLEKELHTSSEFGLADEEASLAREKYGLNKIAEKDVHWWIIFARQFKSSFTFLLLCAAVISLLLGETVDSLMILMFVLINSALGFYQEYKS